MSLFKKKTMQCFKELGRLKNEVLGLWNVYLKEHSMQIMLLNNSWLKKRHERDQTPTLSNSAFSTIITGQQGFGMNEYSGVG